MAKAYTLFVNGIYNAASDSEQETLCPLVFVLQRTRSS